MPAASDAELHAAAENYRRYLGVVRRIIERTKPQQLPLDSPDSDRRRTLGDNTPKT